ncbi:MAG: DUF1850 domain-containing protein [Clostridiales bacterium]|nr:DUF1850 domain-containing protein [Clostridiales bacterium]
MGCSEPVELRKHWVKAAAACVALVAFTVLYFCLSDTCLLLKDGDSGGLLAAFPIENGGEFSVRFVHSVNKTPVTDVYQVRGRGIFVVRTVYYSFGAGVQSEIGDGQTLEYGEDGSMTVGGFDRRMDKLSYIVGTVSDHVLEIGGRSVGLRELCGRNTTVRFTVGRRILLGGG